MEKTINRLHRQLLAAVNQNGGDHGALVIVDTMNGDKATITSFSGGRPEPIMMGLLKEMQRDAVIVDAVRGALMLFDNKQFHIAKSN